MGISCLSYNVMKQQMSNVFNVLDIFMQFLNFIKLCPELQCRCLQIVISERFMVILMKLNLNFNLYAMQSSENITGDTFHFCNRSKGNMQ